VWKSRLVCDFEDFDFFDSEMAQSGATRDRTLPGVIPQSNALRVINGRVASETVGVCVAVIGNKNVTIEKQNATKAVTTTGVALNCPRRSIAIQWKSLRRNVVRILQCEDKTLQTVIRLDKETRISVHFVRFLSGFPLQRSEIAENVPFPVQNHCQNVCVTVTEAVKVCCFETIATAPPQKFEMFSPEFCENLSKVRNDLRIPPF
jgi:hypothetical protein